MTETKIEASDKSSSSKPKRIRGDAVTRLAKETARNVRNKSTELSDALFRRALAGDVNCTKLLLLLIEKCPPRKEKRKRRSIAEELANAPQWQGPWPEVEDNDEDEEIQPWETAKLAKNG